MTIETPTAKAVMARAAIFVRVVTLIDERFQIADVALDLTTVDAIHQEVLRLVTDCGCDDPIAAAHDALLELGFLKEAREVVP